MHRCKTIPFSGNTFTNVAGAPTAVAGHIVQSAVWDNIHSDYATALTMLMSQLTSIVTNRNALYMNGGMEVWQRGAGSSASIAVAASTLAYTADRWYLQTGANQASIVSAQAGLTNGSTLCARVIRNAAQTGTTAIVFAYPLDTDEIYRLRGSKVSFTATVKAGAAWSPTSGTLTAILYVGTGAVGKRNATPYTGETTALSIATNLTAGGAVTTITGNSSAVIPTTTTQAELQFTWTPVGTAGATDSIDIDDVQLEAQVSDSTWTPTDYDRLDFFTMYTACQRHYFKTFFYGTAPAAGASVQGALSVISQATTRAGIYVQFPVKMRTTPGVGALNPSAGNSSWRNVTSGADSVSTVDPNATLSDSTCQILTATVSAIDQSLLIHFVASAGI